MRSGRRPDRIQAGQFFAYLGAAAGAGRVLGLDVRGMQSAFGLAVMQVAGSRQSILEGDVPAKAIYGAFPNQAGVPWPVSAEVAPYIEAAIQLALHHDLRPEEIARVEVLGAERIRPWCEPIEERRRPVNAAAAANSAIFGAAKSLAHRAVGLQDFTPQGLRDDAALAIASKTTARLEPGIAGNELRVTTTSGAELRSRIATPLGHPARALSDEHLARKFSDCCGASRLAPSLSADRVKGRAYNGP